MNRITTALMALILCASLHALANDGETNAVIQAFQAQGIAIAGNQADTNRQAFLRGKLGDPAHLYARLENARDCHRRIDGTLSEIERKELILNGDIPDLIRDGQCWRVESFGGYGAEVCGYLTTNTLDMILFWIVPEG